jgi:DNA segregation ATPase FtsK/SpoIIIE-like protein
MMAGRLKVGSTPSAGRHFLREAEGLAGGAVALFVALALVSYSPDLPRQNLGGPVGHLLADTVLRALGVAAYLFPVYLGFVAVALLRRNGDDLGGARLGGAVLLIGGVAAIAGLIAGGKATVRGGGWLGGFLGTALRGMVGAPGAYLVIAVVLVMSLVLATGVSAFEMAHRIGRWSSERVRAGAGWMMARARRQPARADEPVRPARASCGPIQLVDALEAAPSKPEPVEKRDAPPIIREPERRLEPPRKARRTEMQ